MLYLLQKESVFLCIRLHLRNIHYEIALQLFIKINLGM